MEGAKGEVTFTFEKRQEVKVRKDDLANSSVLHRMVKRRFFGGEGWANTFAWRPPKNISLSVGVGSSKCKRESDGTIRNKRIKKYFLPLRSGSDCML